MCVCCLFYVSKQNEKSVIEILICPIDIFEKKREKFSSDDSLQKIMFQAIFGHL